MKVTVQYWNPKINDACISEVTNEYEWEGTEDEIFLKMYKKNNSLRYCNGSYYKFKDVEIEKKYRDNYKKYNTFNNFYSGSYVD